MQLTDSVNVIRVTEITIWIGACICVHKAIPDFSFPSTSCMLWAGYKFLGANVGLCFPSFWENILCNFKKAKSKLVDLLNDSHKIMKLLLDIVFEETCEMESLDDIILLMEVVERYQINKVPVQQMCDEAILTQMNAITYFVAKICQCDARG